MIRFYRFISLILHPAVLPTIGVLLYFLFIPKMLTRQQELYILGLVFLVTYIIPIIVLILSKALKLIKDMYVMSVRERKIPVLLMIVLFYLLGRVFTINSITYDLGVLFYASSLGLIIVNILFIWKFKTSLHLLGIGNTLGFLLVLNHQYGIKALPAIMIIILLAGVLGSARIYLKAHHPIEVYVGFLLGLVSQFFMFYLL